MNNLFYKEIKIYFIKQYMNDILERIKKVEALILWAKSDWEKKAAEAAKERILKKYPEIDRLKDKKEYKIHTQDSWHKKLFIAICRKYWINPFRYYRQKYTTVMININEKFLDEVLRPEYLEYSKYLEDLLWDVIGDLINKIHKDQEEVIIRWSLE
jgi:hypothetical protein